MSTSNTNGEFNTSTPVLTKVGRELRRYSNWLVSFVPESIRRTVSEKTTSLKNKLTSIYNSFISEEPTVTPIPVEIENAFKKKVGTFRIEGKDLTDYKTFLKSVEEQTIALLNEQKKPMKVRLLLFCMFYRMVDNEKVTTNSHFSTKNDVVTEATDLIENLDTARERLIELLENFQKNGSGWIFEKVLHFDIHINEFKPLSGSTYIKLPKFLSAKKAIINPNNEDNECFKWCVTEAVYPQKRDRGRITKKSRENAELFNWVDIKFPLELKQITKFEKNNPEYTVNVLGYEGDVFPLRISKHIKSKTVINLLLISDETTQHYTIVKDLSRLVGSQTSNHDGKKHICLNCLNVFHSEKSLNNHQEYCMNNESVKIIMPKEGSTLKFNHFNKKLKVPFVIYADFECFTEKLETDDYDDRHSHTSRYQKHTPSGVSFYIVYRDLDVEKQKPFLYSGENVAEEFCSQLTKITKDIYEKYLKKIIPMKMTEDDKIQHRLCNVCHICGGSGFSKDNKKVRDHDHLTGRFRGTAHNICNLAFKEPNFIPVVFHNLSGYDAHLFIRQLGVSEGDIDCIPNNEEKYISFTKKILVDEREGKDHKITQVFLNNRFIDSAKFMNATPKPTQKPES